jgi:hypothetical protein
MKKNQVKFQENMKMGLTLIVGISAAVSCAITIIVLSIFVIATKLGT